MEIKQKEKEVINGNDIIRFETIGSMFARGNSLSEQSSKTIKRKQLVNNTKSERRVNIAGINIDIMNMMEMSGDED